MRTRAMRGSLILLLALVVPRPAHAGDAVLLFTSRPCLAEAQYLARAGRALSHHEAGLFKLPPIKFGKDAEHSIREICGSPIEGLDLAVIGLVHAPTREVRESAGYTLQNFRRELMISEPSIDVGELPPVPSEAAVQHVIELIDAELAHHRASLRIGGRAAVADLTDYRNWLAGLVSCRRKTGELAPLQACLRASQAPARDATGVRH